MKKTARKTEAGEQHAVAHEAHDTTKDLAEALGRYRAVTDTPSVTDSATEAS